MFRETNKEQENKRQEMPKSSSKGGSNNNKADGEISRHIFSDEFDKETARVMFTVFGGEF